ncbi:50S ribosomal protein L22 [Patescibacteria group bacterium]|nr:50S ribosomal protein L22 [Patescibacteria group bacterium]
MEIKADLNNLRMAPRKVRLAANLIKGMSVARAKAQLAFLIRKPAPLILKLLNSAIANAKHNWQIEEDNLFIKSIVVEAGATLKRWLPRAMGRASAIRKRTCSVRLILGEYQPSAAKPRKIGQPEILKEKEVVSESTEQAARIEAPKKETGLKGVAPDKPYGASSESKKRHWSRQTFGNIRKMFRRKSI